MDVSLNFLIPVYNAEKYLERCLDSIYLQIKNTIHEVVLVDDGSTDNSGAICDSFKVRYPNQTIVYHKQNEGVSSTRNFLLNHASKDYIWFIDADDTIQPTAVAEICALIKKNQMPDVVTLGYRQYDGKHYGELRNIYCGSEKQVEGIQYLNTESPKFYLWCNVYRLEFLKIHVLHFNTALSVLEDSLFNVEAYLLCKAMFLSNVYAYNYNVGNPSSAMMNSAYRLRNAEHSFTAIEQIKNLMIKYKGNEEKSFLENYLADTVIGFVYSFYLGNFDVKIVRTLLARLKEIGLYPMSPCKNKRANKFLLLGNRYSLFCFACWLNNKVHPNTLIKSKESLI